MRFHWLRFYLSPLPNKLTRREKDATLTLAFQLWEAVRVHMFIVHAYEYVLTQYGEVKPKLHYTWRPG